MHIIVNSVKVEALFMTSPLYQLLAKVEVNSVYSDFSIKIVSIS